MTGQAVRRANDRDTQFIHLSYDLQGGASDAHLFLLNY